MGKAVRCLIEAAIVHVSPASRNRSLADSAMVCFATGSPVHTTRQGAERSISVHRRNDRMGVHVFALPWSLIRFRVAEGWRIRTRRWLLSARNCPLTRRYTVIAWSCAVLLLAVDVTWLAWSSLRFDPANWQLLAGLVAGAMLARATMLLLADRAARGRTRRLLLRGLGRKSRLLWRAGVLLTLIFAAFLVFTYLATAASLPLRDDVLVAIDRRLGFDWQVFLASANAWPYLAAALSISYHSGGPLLFAIVVWLALAELEVRLAELSAILALTFVGFAIGIVVVPTVGAFAYFAPAEPQFNRFAEVSQMWPFYRTFAALRDGSLRVIELAVADGIVGFPSFHAALAVITIWAVRGHIMLFLPVLMLDALMIVAVLPVGGHHLTELIAGALTAMTAIAIVRVVATRLRPSHDAEVAMTRRLVTPT
jgi:hypothetical protein